MSEQKVSQQKIVNGIEVATVESVIEAMKENPELAKCKFRLNNRWIGGDRNHSTVGKFYANKEENSHLSTFTMDAAEPTLIAGKDKAANPVEYVLHALAGCLTTTLVYQAALQGITIEALESELEGDLDMQGLFGLSNDVRKGYERIRVKFKIKTDEQDLEKLKKLSQFSPVFDLVSNGTSVDISIERK